MKLFFENSILVIGFILSKLVLCLCVIHFCSVPFLLITLIRLGILMYMYYFLFIVLINNTVYPVIACQ